MAYIDDIADILKTVSEIKATLNGLIVKVPVKPSTPAQSTQAEVAGVASAQH